MEEIICPKIKKDAIKEEMLCIAYVPPTIQDPEKVAAGTVPPSEPAKVVAGTESGKVLMFPLPDEVSLGKGPEMDPEAEALLAGIGAEADAGHADTRGPSHADSDTSSL